MGEISVSCCEVGIIGFTSKMGKWRQLAKACDRGSLVLASSLVCDIAIVEDLIRFDHDARDIAAEDVVLTFFAAKAHRWELLRSFNDRGGPVFNN